MCSKLSMNKAICLHALLGIIAGVLFSSCICGTPKNFKEEEGCNLWDNTARSLSNVARTIYNAFLIMAIKFLHYLISRCGDYKSTAAYTMLMPFWVAFTLSLSYVCQTSHSAE